MVDEDGVLTIPRATNDNDWFLGFASASWAVGAAPYGAGKRAWHRPNRSCMIVSHG